MLERIRVLLNEFNLHSNEEGQFFLEFNNHYFSVSRFNFSLLTVLKDSGKKRKFNEQEVMARFKLNQQEFKYTCFQIEDQLKEILNKKFKSSIYFKLTLINKKYVHLLTSATYFLIPTSVNLFLSLLIATSAIFLVLLGYMEYPDLQLQIGDVNIIYFYISIILCSVFHELGHASAARRFNKTPGEIGVGIFFLFPVFYSDVSSIWTLNRNQRIIINLSGILFQIIFCLILSLLFLNDVAFITSFLYVNMAIVFFSLFPFIKTDGYWVLSDLLDKKNLYENANKYIINLFHRQVEFDWFYFFYSSLHLIFISFLLFYLGRNLTTGFTDILSKDSSWTTLIIVLFQSFVFILLIRSFFGKLKKEEKKIF